jgi:hypothetical protein
LVQLWVADTCALSEVRRIPRVGKAGEFAVFKELTKRVVTGQIIYPVEVITELKQTQGSTPFYPYEWADGHRTVATPKTSLFDDVKQLLKDPQIKLVLDPSKTGPPEEADPYVLALALRRKQKGEEVVVLSQERRDRPRKLSVNTACGLLRLYCLPMEAFLVQEGII